MAAEYKKQPGLSKISIEAAMEAIAPLMSISQPINHSDENKRAYHFDAALVARFLSAEGRWHLSSKEQGEDT